MAGNFSFLKWSRDKQLKVGQNIYLPFAYTHASKRGNENHFLNVVLLEDLPIIFLVYALPSSFTLPSLVSLFSLTLSFWCIYEVGYFENDLFELNYESAHKNIHKLEYIKRKQNFPLELFAWIWAIGLGAIGVVFLQGDICTSLNCALNLANNLLLWVIWLIIVRIVYRIYNSCHFSVRQLVFPLLQVSRLAGPVLFFSISFLGVFLVTAQVVSRWVGYLVYRGGGNPKQINQKFVRHLTFILLVSGLAIVQEMPQIFVSFQFIVIVLWSIVRGHFRPVLKSIRHGKCDLSIKSSSSSMGSN